MAEDFPECEQFNTRKRQICRGEVLTLAKCNAYRTAWGLSPIPSNATESASDQQEKTKFRGLGDVVATPRQPVRCNSGPGGHLKRMLSQMGLQACLPCSGRSQQMDQWGVEGCRKNRATIIGWLAESAKSTTWKKYLMAGTAAAIQGLPLTIPDLVDEAIRRAETNDAHARIHSDPR